MALNGIRLGIAEAAALKAAVTSAGIVPGTPVTDAQLEALWKAVATAEVTEITTNAVVPAITAGPGSTVVT